MSRKLVAYFSASGITAKAAELLADSAGADIYEIQPEVPYTTADLDWTDTKSRSTIEMQDKSFRPPLADKSVNIADYDVIFLGFPIWWYVAPTIINTFLEAYDFSGKTIVLFATSGGSDFGNTLNELKVSLPDTAVITEGKLLNGKLDRSSLIEWVESLDI